MLNFGGVGGVGGKKVTVSGLRHMALDIIIQQLQSLTPWRMGMSNDYVSSHASVHAWGSNG